MRARLLFVAFTAACADDPAIQPTAGDPLCARLPEAPDRERKVLVQKPYLADASPSRLYELLSLSTEGELSATGVTFQMGRDVYGEIVFTPDGQIAIAAQDDGTLGVVRFDDHTPHVVHATLGGAFYASSVVMDPCGERLFVLDRGWRDNGGGIYALRIEADGSLVEEGLIAPAKLPAALVWLDGGRAALVAKDALDSTAVHEAHLLDWSAAPSRLASVAAFTDDEGSISAAAVTPDGRYLVLGDNSEYSTVAGNRLGVLAIGADTLTPARVLTQNDPVALVASPFNNALLALDGYGNAAVRWAYTADAADPFTNLGEISYVGGAPQLPNDAVMLGAGSLTGLVLVSEVQGIRRLRFESDGRITDLGVFTLVPGDALDGIPGALGVEP